ncbi:MAG TPA: protein kinase [Kofleriaceae bacterium]|nr:protein kinase [Kofleriaceae bacterium]
MNPTEPTGRLQHISPLGLLESASVTPTAARLTQLGEYDLLYRLGTGGMGNVYLARRRNESGLHRLFAVKAMHSVLSADAEFANMFLDEAHIASQLHHINVVGIVDLGRVAGRLYLVMDYVEGPTMAHLMAATTERRPALMCAIVIDLLHGLQAAHSLTNDSGESLELVHRDVSPSNILIGTDGVARLTDFGIAKARMRRTSTSPGVRKGKLSYSAPEQITNPGAEDSRVDVFAAGVVLWNALTGSRLFDGDNEAAVILSVITRPILPPSGVGLRPPACLDRVCLRALSRDPAERYSSAAEMAEDLRRVTRAHDLVAGPEQVAEWVAEVFGAELAQRRAAIRATASGTDLGLAAGSFARGTGPHAPDLDEYADIAITSGDSVGPTARRAPPRKRRLALGLMALAACAAAASAYIKAYSREARQAARSSSALAPMPAPAAAIAEPVAPASPVVRPMNEAPGAPIDARPAPVIATRAAPADGATGAPDRSSAALEAGRAEEARPEAASRMHRRRKPVPAVKRRAPPVRAEASSGAEQADQAPAASEPAQPAAPEAIETNPYLRRGGTRGR